MITIYYTVLYISIIYFSLLKCIITRHDSNIMYCTELHIPPRRCNMIKMFAFINIFCLLFCSLSSASCLWMAPGPLSSPLSLQCTAIMFSARWTSWGGRGSCATWRWKWRAEAFVLTLQCWLPAATIFTPDWRTTADQTSLSAYQLR